MTYSCYMLPTFIKDVSIVSAQHIYVYSFCKGNSIFISCPSVQCINS